MGKPSDRKRQKNRKERRSYRTRRKKEKEIQIDKLKGISNYFSNEACLFPIITVTSYPP